MKEISYDEWYNLMSKIDALNNDIKGTTVVACLALVIAIGTLFLFLYCTYVYDKK